MVYSGLVTWIAIGSGSCTQSQCEPGPLYSPLQKILIVIEADRQLADEHSYKNSRAVKLIWLQVKGGYPEAIRLPYFLDQHGFIGQHAEASSRRLSSATAVAKIGSGSLRSDGGVVSTKVVR